MRKKFTKSLLGAGLALLAGAAAATAGPLMDRIAAGDPIRIGFANEVPWAYPGEGNKPAGFVNAHAIGVLNAMGYTNIEPVVTEWGALIPSLQAGRLDLITGGMYIIGKRCENVSFSAPMAKVSDAFIVAPGNPNNINTMEDLAGSDYIMAAVAGHNTIGVAKDVGVSPSNIMELPGITEVLAAVKAGRADAGAAPYFSATNLVKQAGGDVEISDVTKQPDERANWVGIGFRHDDTDFRDAFDTAQAGYIGSDAMLDAVGEYGYGKDALPDGKSTDWVCANR